MMRHRRERKRPDLAVDRSIERRSARPRRPRRRRLLPLAFGLAVGILLACVLAPTIVSHTPLGSYLLQLGARALPVRIRCDSLSLGWLRSPEMRGIHVADAQGVPLADLPRVRIGTPLWRLLTDPEKLGHVQIDQPTLYARCRAGESNWEELLLLSPRDNSDWKWSGELTIRDATLSVVDEPRHENWSFTGWQASVQFPEKNPGSVRFEASLPAANADVPLLAARGQFNSVNGADVSVNTEVQLELSDFPCRSLQVLATRFHRPMNLDGTISGHLSTRWHSTDSDSPSEVAGSFTLRDLQADAPDWRNGKIQIERVVASLQVLMRASEISVEQFAIDSSLGKVDFSGQLERTAASPINAHFLSGWWPQRCQLSGNLDLAQAGRSMPGWLHLREDTQLTSGQLAGDLKSQDSAEGTRWIGSLETSQLRARRGGREFAIDQPVRISIQLAALTGELRIEEMAGQSTFFGFRGEGTAQNGQLAWRADLNRLHRELDQLIDWGEIQLTGQLDGFLGWQSNTGNQIHAAPNVRFLESAQFSGQDSPDASAPSNSALSIAIPQGARGVLEFLPRRWKTHGHVNGSNVEIFVGTSSLVKEPQVRLDFTADAQGDFRQVAVVSGADVRLLLADDALHLQLADCDILPADRRHLPMHVQLSGQLGRWMNRFQTASQIEMPRWQGRLDADMNLIENQDGIQIANSRIRLDQLQIYNAQQQRIWEEPFAQVRVRGSYDRQRQSVSLDAMEVATAAVQLQGAGRIEDLTRECILQLAGQVRYDLPRLCARLRPIWGEQVQFAGQAIQPFAIAGPCVSGNEPTIRPVSVSTDNQIRWFPDALTAQTGFGWDTARIWGLDLPSGSLTARLHRQRLSIDPFTIPISGGQLHLAPQVRLVGNPVLEMAPGLVAEKIQITPEVCHGWLKYVAPLVADATQAEGLFSLSLDYLRVPMHRPTAAQLSGRLSVHSARIGPGPLSQQLLNVSNQIRAIVDPARQTAGNTGSSLNWVLMPQQEVSFRLEQGRVWHENLTMRVGDLPLRTTGWVALNQHLSLTAAIPFQERWVGSNRWLAGLKGQTIAVPIGGTLQAPQLDTRGLTELNRQIVTGAAGGLLQQELQKQLDRLLPQSSSGRQDK